MKIFLAILSVILLFGMIGDKEPENRKNYTYGFIAVILSIAVMYLI